MNLFNKIKSLFTPKENHSLNKSKQESGFQYSGQIILPLGYLLSPITLSLINYSEVVSLFYQNYDNLIVNESKDIGLEDVEKEFKRRIEIETREYKKIQKTNKFRKSVEKIKKATLNWEALLDPNRHAETMLWLKYHKDKREHPNGKVGESLLHWAVLTNLGLTIELLEECNYDPNIEDKNGYTPLDWLLERFIYAILMENHAMPPESKYKIYRMTEDIGLFLYEKGGVSKHYSEVDLLTKGGCRIFLANIFRINGLSGLRTVPPYNSSALHSWVGLVESENKNVIFEDLIRFGLDINEKDELDQTPLFYCIDGFICKPQYYLTHWKKVIVTLLENGADPYIKTKKDLTTLDLFDISSKQEKEMLAEYKKLIRQHYKPIKIT